MCVCVSVGLGKSKLGGGQAKRRKGNKKPLDILDDGQTLSLTSLQVMRSVVCVHVFRLLGLKYMYVCVLCRVWERLR